MIDFLCRDLTDATWKAHADRMMDAMFDEGVLSVRSRLTGGETAIFAMAWREFGDAERTPVGMAVFYQPEEQAMLWLDLIYVEPSFRRVGLGRTLVMQALGEARRQGLTAVEFGTDLHNAAMIGLAQKAGFGEAEVFFRREV